ncbi:MAG: ABC transporter permease [Candidatus Bipolaricaulis sp.]|nr:ABC transporter permease [Candidatus Bipolaricaulis sp.]MDD5219581.1 ABC transporter permease [Candidatus Bipolaricaulis sp.]MDD5645849.1 ABC transporter permease [Candidatus Bipolaricaulis sp.]
MSGLPRYALQRLLLTIPMLFILVTVVFLLLRVMPGDPVSAMLGGKNVSDEVLATYRVKFGFDRPLLQQYGEYISGIVRGDFGRSIRTNQLVLQELARKFPATLELAIFGILVSLGLGFTTGLIAAVRADRPVDHAIRVFHIASFAMPLFWLGLMLQVFFAVKLGWLPVASRLGGRLAFTFKPITGLYALDAVLRWDGKALVDVLQHLVLPAFTLGIALTGLQGRITRASMLEVLDQDYITTARSKGLHERVVQLRHGLRNALIPIITVFGLQFAVLMGGAVLTETVFSWPGIASYLVLAIGARDYPSIQGSVVFIALFISVINLIVDLLYSVVDPRVRY